MRVCMTDCEKEENSEYVIQVNIQAEEERDDYIFVKFLYPPGPRILDTDEKARLFLSFPATVTEIPRNSRDLRSRSRRFLVI